MLSGTGSRKFNRMSGSGPGELSPSDAFRAAMELHDAGVRLMRKNLKRAHPEASAEEVDRRLRAWLGGKPLVTRRDTMLRVVEDPDGRL